MSFNNSFTAVTGATYTAAQYNTHVRDNFTAIWVYTTAGDMAYATSGTSLARFGIGAADTVIQSNGSVPSWTHSPAIKGVLHTFGLATFNPAGQTFSSTWADITGATLDLILTKTCSILLMAIVTGYNGSGGRAFSVRGVVDGTADSMTQPYNGGATARNEALPYFYTATGITAGTRTMKMQCQADTSSNVVERGRLLALAFGE